MTTAEAIWFAILLAMVMIWFGLILWLFRRLRTHHASTYEALGSPTLFWNNSPANNLRLLGFIFSAKTRELQDPAMFRICKFMRIFLVAYVVVFLALMLSMFAK
jgi:hypothetical protein